MKIQYIGMQENPFGENFRLFNIWGHPTISDGSTVSEKSIGFPIPQIGKGEIISF